LKVYETGSHVKKDDENLQEASFGIGDAVTIFRLLRDKIYSDKVTAVIREYVANAVDAHAVSAQTRAVDIFLPSFTSPNFYVRDYGDGLSEEDIRDIYVMYGTSTKRATNNEVGQLGLGCKSAFAYNDTFTVVSYQGGKAITYTAYIDDTGVGKIRTMNVATSSEPSGIKVLIPVKSSDISWFVTKAKAALCYYPQKFNIVSGQHLDYFDKKEQVLHGTSGPAEWYITSYGKPTIVMGGIPYPLNADLALDGATVEPWVKGPCIIFVPIGAVDFAVSREMLEYTKRTKGFLKKAVTEITKDISESIEKQLTSCKNLYAAKVAYEKLSSARLVNSITPKWKGASLSGIIVSNHPCIAYVSDWAEPRIIQYQLNVNGSVEAVYFVEKPAKIDNWLGRLRALAKANYEGKRQSYTVVYDPSKDLLDATKANSKTIKETYNLDLYEWQKIEDFEPIPAPPKPTSIYSYSSDYSKKNSYKYRAKAFQWRDGQSKGNIASSYWDQIKMDDQTPVKDRPYVIVKSGFKLDYGGTRGDAQSLKELLNSLYSVVPAAKGPIYAFRAPVVVADLPPGIMPFQDWLKKQVATVDIQLLNDKTLYNTLVNTKKWNITNTIYTHKALVEKKLAPSSPFRTALATWYRLTIPKNITNVNSIRRLGDLPTISKPVDYEGIFSRYPLVEVIAASASYFQQKDVADQVGSYVAMIDDYLLLSQKGEAEEKEKGETK